MLIRRCIERMCLPIVIHFGISLGCAALAQDQLVGVTMIDKFTSAAVSGPTAPIAALQIAPIVVPARGEVTSILQANGIHVLPSTVEAIKQLNPQAFEGNNLRSGSLLYVPALKLSDPKLLERYAIRFNETDLSRLQLQSDALAARRLASRMESFAEATASSGVLKDQASLLRLMATDLEKLGTRHSAQLGGSELSTVSFQKEVAEYLSTASMKADASRRIQNFHLLKEVTQSVATIADGASSADANKKIGKKVVIHYAYLPSKKPMHGRQLYALPRGMQAFPRNFTSDIMGRALAIHRFDGITSPSSKLLAWGHFVVIAGPQQITEDFVRKVMENQRALDVIGVSITTTSTWEELELFLPVRNP